MLYRRTKVYKGRGRLKFYFSSMSILEYNLIACLFRDVVYIGIEYERRVTCIYYLYIYMQFSIMLIMKNRFVEMLSLLFRVRSDTFIKV